MNCCDQDCHQGKDCPIRRGPPIQPTDEQIARWKAEDDRLDMEDLLTIGSAIALAVVTVLWLIYVVGGWL